MFSYLRSYTKRSRVYVFSYRISPSIDWQFFTAIKRIMQSSLSFSFSLLLLSPFALHSVQLRSYCIIIDRRTNDQRSHLINIINRCATNRKLNGRYDLFFFRSIELVFLPANDCNQVQKESCFLQKIAGCGQLAICRNKLQIACKFDQTHSCVFYFSFANVKSNMVYGMPWKLFKLKWFSAIFIFELEINLTRMILTQINMERTRFWSALSHF